MFFCFLRKQPFVLFKVLVCQANPKEIMTWTGCGFLSHLSESGVSVWLLHHSLEQRFQGSGLQLGCAFGGCRFICIQQGVWEREGEGRILPRRWWWARPRSLEAMHIPSDAYPLSIIQSWLQLISKKAGKCSWNNEPKKYGEPHSPTYQWFHPNVTCLLFPCLTSSMLMVIICINSLQM